MIDPRRFRKNVIVDTGPESDGFPEFGWVGRRLRIGAAVCGVTTSVAPCVMVGLPQAELPRDREIPKSLARNTGMDLGVYLRVIEPGRIAEGDAVHLL